MTNTARSRSLRLSARAMRWQDATRWLGTTLLLGVASLSVLAVLFIFYYIAREALPFFQSRGFREFFTSTAWYPSAQPPKFGSLAILVGSLLVTLGAVSVAVPLGIAAAICLSDILPFGVRQMVKPVIELLAAIPSVAYGFFALVVLAPLLQEKGGAIFRGFVWVVGAPLGALFVVIASGVVTARLPSTWQKKGGVIVGLLLAVAVWGVLRALAERAGGIRVDSGTNALNASLILGIMALPTVVSVSEDALQAAGREIREGSYALGATRSETLLRVVLPAAGSGIAAAVILGVMRAVGETMVVWMASGNAAQIPRPWYNFLSPVRTLTATIAGDMGEADHVTGSERYAVLFAMALTLLVFSFCCNLAGEWAVRHSRRRMAGG